MQREAVLERYIAALEQLRDTIYMLRLIIINS